MPLIISPARAPDCFANQFSSSEASSNGIVHSKWTCLLRGEREAKSCLWADSLQLLQEAQTSSEPQNAAYLLDGRHSHAVLCLFCNFFQGADEKIGKKWAESQFRIPQNSRLGYHDLSVEVNNCLDPPCIYLLEFLKSPYVGKVCAQRFSGPFLQLCPIVGKPLSLYPSQIPSTARKFPTDIIWTFEVPALQGLALPPAPRYLQQDTTEEFWVIT